MLGVKQSFDFLKDLPLAKWVVVKDSADLSRFSFPYFLKVDISGHKTEGGAVVRCNSLEEARINLQKLHQKFPNDLIIAQESLEGIEMIVGLKEDAVFGKLLVVGFGGIFAEIKKDVSFRVLPVSRQDVVSMVSELKGVEIFQARGKNYDLEKFYTLIEKVAILGDKKAIVELDLNPVMVGEKSSKIVDARVELTKELFR